RCGYRAYDWNTIATSRSRAGTRLTTRSPIWMVPVVTDSSPAIMRSAVVFPQPDGPTRTTNSPSRTSRLRSRTALVPSPYTLPSSLNTSWATNVSLTVWHCSGTVRYGAPHHNDAVQPDQPCKTMTGTRPGPLRAAYGHLKN